MSVKECASCKIVIVLYDVLFQLLLKYKLSQLDFRDRLSQEEGERKMMVAVNREKISRFIENQWLHYLYIIKERGEPY
jgi:hypothetical protein